MKEKVFTERDRKPADGTYMDNPENAKTDKQSIYDMHEDMKFVDAISLEDLRIEQIGEQHGPITQHDSSSEPKISWNKMKKTAEPIFLGSAVFFSTE